MTHTRQQQPNANRHHILHTRGQHESNRNNHWLRNRMGLIVLMDIGVHRELHRECPEVPPLGSYMAQLVRNELHPDTNPFRALDAYRRAVENAQDHPRAKPIEREMADLTLRAVELQIPYLHLGHIERS